MSAPTGAHFTHTTVLLREAVDALRIQPDGVYVDGTFGRGGHSREILARLDATGRLIAVDRDPAAVAAAKEIGDARLTMAHSGFSELDVVLARLGVGKIDGLLLDLGISSPQIDEAGRGFSFRFDAPLDMRMDTSKGPTAAEWLAEASEQEIREVIEIYGEERFAKQIAKALVAARSGEPVVRTRQLAELVGEAVRTREPGQDPATRTFQAIRIFINQELAQLSLILDKSLHFLRPGGRLAVISFHSLEDRIVKRFMRDQAQPDAKLSAAERRLPVRATELPQPTFTLVGKALRPSSAEVKANPRSRSAILRVAERTAVQVN